MYDAHTGRSVPSGQGCRLGMKTNVVELLDRIRPQAGARLILCVCPCTTPRDETAWVWVFRENARGRLKQLWSGVLDRSESDEVASVLERENSVWLGDIDTLHDPPSRRFRLVWTLPPAPCRIYTRRGLITEVESAVVTRHLFWRRKQSPMQSWSVVEGWIGRDWRYAGISLKGHGGEEWEVVRIKNEGLFTQVLLMYDGIDLMVDTFWLDRVVPRVAEVFGLGWKIVDYTVTPPKIDLQGGPELAPATSNE